VITSLAYLGIKSPNYGEWPDLVTKVWGAQLAEPGPDGAVRIKFDDALWRLQIHPGEQDETAYIGWGVDHEEDLQAVLKTLADLGVAAEVGSDELAAERAVNRIITFTDPWGFRHEVTWGQSHIACSFQPSRPISGFVTGQQGLGHVLLLLPDIEQGHDFFSKLGFRLSDKIIVPGRLNARFYHCNARHHTLALGQCPPELAAQHGVPITRRVGRHSHDRQFSFYHSTPSSFHVEYGFGGLEVDEEAWVPRVYDRTAIWGHRPHPSGKGRPMGIMHQLS
jgi:extradiol dioxygenase